MPLLSFPGSETHIFYGTNTFRCLLDSLARPGKLNQLEYPAFPGTPPTCAVQGDAAGIPLNLYALGALATLLDGETSFVLSNGESWLGAVDEAVHWLMLCTGAHLVDPASAHFAFFCTGRSAGLLRELSIGSLLEPESSATAIYCVEQLSTAEHEGQGALVLELSGPGISASQRLNVVGMEARELEYIQTTRRGYPLGVDIYLIDAAGRCAGLPRTTEVVLMAEERR